MNRYTIRVTLDSPTRGTSDYHVTVEAEKLGKALMKAGRKARELWAPDGIFVGLPKQVL